jgi:hypothetical protein
MKDDLVWHQALDGWAKQQADFSTLVYKCSVEYGRLWPHFFRPGCEAVANGLEKYLDPDDADDPLMEHAPVTTDDLESTFGTLDYLNNASHRVDIWANFGQAIALKTGIFLSFQKRVRIENGRRRRACLPVMTEEASVNFLARSPMVILENMPEHQFQDVYKACRRITPPQFKKFRTDKKKQLLNDLLRKEEKVKEQERREAKALQRYKDKQHFLVYTSMPQLLTELDTKHASGKEKYTATMQCEIVVAQLQYRRDCLARCLRPGALCSSHTGSAQSKLQQLLQHFASVLCDEQHIPSLLKPPSIRRKYASHMFATSLRSQLDRDRNSITAAMTEAFIAAYEGGTFTGWRCTVDYSRSHPLNPEALIGLRVAKLFDGVEWGGEIVSFKKWWKIKYDDGDCEDVNYRDLMKLHQPPDCSSLVYESPAQEFDSFMRDSGGKTKLKNNACKKGEPNVFILEREEWTFISVYLVQDSKIPIQGAYIGRSLFEIEARDLTLLQLKAAYPEARLSPMEDIQLWIDRSKELDEGFCALGCLPLLYLPPLPSHHLVISAPSSSQARTPT